MLAAPGRLDHGAGPAGPRRRAGADRRGRGDQRDRPPAARDPGRARAGRAVVLRVRADDPRGAVPGQQARQGLRPHQPDRVQLPAVHGQRGQRLQAVARRGRAARLLPGLRPRRRVPRDRRQHGRLPPDPVPADDGPGQGRRQADRGRPAAHRHRRQGRPVPADHARAPTWRCSTACCTCWSRTAISTRTFIAAHTEGWEAMPEFLADYPPDDGRRASPASPRHDLRAAAASGSARPATG